MPAFLRSYLPFFSKTDNDKRQTFFYDYLFMALVAIKQGALPAVLFFLAVYAVMDLGAFGLLGALSEIRDDLDDLGDFQGLGFARPWCAAVFAVCLLSPLVGLFPTGGFLGKLFLFWAVIKGGFF